MFVIFMKRMFRITYFLLLTLVFACTRTSQESQAGFTPIAVSWSLVSNFAGPNSTFEARFTINNKSNIELTDKNWALFFSMQPRMIHENQTPQPAILQHLNGDWYKMTPEPGFQLAPGDSVEIRYWGTEGIIKENDAPLGLYFVFYDEQGEEREIAQVNNYTIGEFTTREQLLRDETDRLEPHSTAKIYRQNKGMSEVAADLVKRIIPSPKQFQLTNSTFKLNDGFSVAFSANLEQEARFLSNHFQSHLGLNSQLKQGDTQGDVVLKIGTIAEGDEEAYRLTINDKGIEITGSDPAGVFYGIQSLIAMVPVENWKSKSKSIDLEGVSIADAPRFSFRSMHLDVSRNFQTKETVMRILDLLAFYKINHMLLYVTEDEGWRVEIEGLPELTEVGGQRGHVSGIEANALHPSYGSGPIPYEKGKHGSGYYTRAEFIEILKYAKERHITIIPELNFPGHARAAIKSMEVRYERLMKEGKKEEAEEFRLIDPDDKSEYLSAQFYKDNVVCVARESVYRFYEKVVDAYIDMYKEAGLTLKKFNIGGDEVAEGAWTKSPMAAKLLEENPSIKDPKNLHIYFLRKLLPILQKKNIEVHGWEEIALEKNEKGVYVPNPEFVGKGVVPYIWNNLFDLDLGNRLANAGYPVVLCNVTNFYMDLAYNNDPKEPGAYWGGFVDARANWEFAPYDYFKTTFATQMGEPLDFSKAERLRPEARKNIIGIESQLWAETVRGRDLLEYYILPKVIAFSESAWASTRTWEDIENAVERKKQADIDWNIFANRLGKVELPRLAYWNGGYNYRVPPPGAIIEDGMLKANTELPGLSIRYTTDGSEPSINSIEYSEPVAIDSKTIRIRAFDSSGRGSRTIELKH